MNKFKVTYQEDSKVLKKELLEEELKDFIASKDIIKIKEVKSLKDTLYKYSPVKQSILPLIEELSMLLESNFSFSDSVDLLLKSEHKEIETKVLLNIKKALDSGNNFKSSMQRIKDEIGPMGVMFFNLAYESGNLSEVLKNYYEYLLDIENIRKKVIKTIRYPIFLLIFTLLSIILMFNTVVKEFRNLFDNLDKELSFSTKLLFLAADYYLYIFATVIAIVLIGFFLIRDKVKNKNTLKSDKFLFQKIYLVSDILKYYHFYMFFNQMELFMKNKYSLQDSLKNTLTYTNNIFLRKKIENIITNINNGMDVYEAFKDSLLFDEIVLRHIYIGSKTNNFLRSLRLIVKNFNELLNKKINILISIIQPLFFLSISLFILWIILSLFLPLWDVNN